MLNTPFAELYRSYAVLLLSVVILCGPSSAVVVQRAITLHWWSIGFVGEPRCVAIAK